MFTRRGEAAGAGNCTKTHKHVTASGHSSPFFNSFFITFTMSSHRRKKEGSTSAREASRRSRSTSSAKEGSRRSRSTSSAKEGSRRSSSTQERSPRSSTSTHDNRKKADGRPPSTCFRRKGFQRQSDERRRNQRVVAGGGRSISGSISAYRRPQNSRRSYSSNSTPSPTKTKRYISRYFSCLCG